MPAKINFYRSNKLVNPPKNWKELALELNFDRDKQTVQSQVSITEWEMVRENNDEVLSYIDKGLTNGVGVFEGEPLRIELERNGTIEKPFTGFLDYTSGRFSRTESTLTAKETNRIDWLNDVADGITFEYLMKEIGSITSTDFIKMPYILNSVPNYMEAAVGVLSVYVMTKEIRDCIQKLIEFTADLPVYYVFSTYIKLILYILYLIILIIALIKLVKSIILLVIQPVKYHACMDVKTQLQKGAEYFGYNLKAPDFQEGVYKDLFIIPEKFFNPINLKQKQILGITDPEIEQIGYYKGTFGDLLREAKKLINGKVVIVDNDLWLVRDDYDISSIKYTLPPIYNTDFSLNTDEFKSNVLISFAYDTTDKNTIQDYTGLSYQAILQPKTVINSNMILMKGFEDVRILFARASTKTDLTVPEAILDAFLKVFGVILGALVKVVNAIIGVLNTIITLVNNILKKLATIGIKLKFTLPPIPRVQMPDLNGIFSNRKGMMMIERDSFTTPKMIIIQLGNSPKFHKVHPNNGLYLSAKYLYENYYHIDSFLPSAEKPNGNQYYIKEYPKVPFVFEDYLKVKENNRIFTSEGEDAIIDSLKWNPWEQVASMKIRISKLYTNNLRLITYEADGQ